jgi:hypothetical protein
MIDQEQAQTGGSDFGAEQAMEPVERQVQDEAGLVDDDEDDATLLARVTGTEMPVRTGHMKRTNILKIYMCYLSLESIVANQRKVVIMLWS